MHQPFPVASAKPQRAVVSRFWGWLGDRDAVAHRLGVPPESRPETIIERTLQCLGVAGLDGLVGEFAAVAEIDGGTLLVRDHLGLVPLYFGWESKNSLVCDADIEVVRSACWNGVVRRQIVVSYLADTDYGPRCDTVFEEVYQVPPGHVVRANSGRVSVSRFSRPELVSSERLTLTQSVGRLRTALRSAVRDALGDSKHVGVHVSGGLDSGVTAAVVQEQLLARNRAVDTSYTWTPQCGPRTRELPEQYLLRITTERLGLAPTHIEVADPANAWLRQSDPLIYRPWSTTAYEAGVGPRCATAGTELVFSGWGGDEVVSNPGISILPWLLKTHSWKAAIREVQYFANRSGRSWEHEAARRAARPIVRKARSAIGLSGSAGANRMAWNDIDSTIARDSATIARHLDFGRFADTREYQLEKIRQGAIAERAEVWWKIANKFGYEYRYPLVDQRVIRCALSWPPDHYRCGGARRRAFRMLAAEYLPEKVAQSSVKQDPLRVKLFLDQRTPIADHLAEWYPSLRDAGATYDSEIG